MGIVVLGTVIETWADYPISTMLFVQDGVVVSADTEVTIVPFVGRSSRGPEGTRYYLGIEQIRDVLDALTQEGVSATPRQKFIAVNHYAENDAFIDPKALTSLS